MPRTHKNALWAPGQSGNPAGSVKKTVPASALPVITKLAAKGVREEDIARAIGLSHPVWHRQRELQQEVADALAAGRQQMHDALCGKLYSKAMAGDTVSLLFLLKCRFGYRETDVPPEQRPVINITLPGPAQTIDAWRAAITVDNDDA